MRQVERGSGRDGRTRERGGELSREAGEQVRNARRGERERERERKRVVRWRGRAGAVVERGETYFTSVQLCCDMRGWIDEADLARLDHGRETRLQDQLGLEIERRHDRVEVWGEVCAAARNSRGRVKSRRRYEEESGEEEERVATEEGRDELQMTLD